MQKKNNRQSSDKNIKSGTEDTSKLSWNDSKEEKLSDFMSDFGDKMDQDYDEYTGDEQLKTRAGEEYPDIFKDGKMKLVDDNDKDADEGESIDIGWDPELKKKYDYQVVSIFKKSKDMLREMCNLQKVTAKKRGSSAAANAHAFLFSEIYCSRAFVCRRADRRTAADFQFSTGLCRKYRTSVFPAVRSFSLPYNLQQIRSVWKSGFHCSRRSAAHPVRLQLQI